MALQVLSPYARMLVSGCKTWELLGHHTARRGRIVIAESNTHLVIGEVSLVFCIPVLKEMATTCGCRKKRKISYIMRRAIEKRRVADACKALNSAKVWA